MATTDRTIPSSSTFNALTRDYLYGYIEEQLWLDTALLTMMKARINWVTGRSVQPLMHYKRASAGGWYGHGEVVDDAVIQQLAGEIATRCKFELARYRQPVVLDSWDTDAQGAHAIVKLFNEYVNDIMEGCREDLGSAIFTGNPATDPDIITGINIALDDTQPWGLIDPTATHYEFWRPHFMDGSGSTYATAVAPSLANFRRMIRRINATVHAKPTVCVVSEDLWDVLAAQMDPNDNAISQRVNDELYKWGFDALRINGVPIVEDLNAPGSAWVTGQSTRATAAGYQALFLNLDKLYISANRQRSFKWDPAGWRRPTNMDAQLNYFYVWMQIVGKNRRANGRIWNMDIEMDLDDMAAVGVGSVTRPVAT